MIRMTEIVYCVITFSSHFVFKGILHWLLGKLCFKFFLGLVLAMPSFYRASKYRG